MARDVVFPAHIAVFVAFTALVGYFAARTGSTAVVIGATWIPAGFTAGLVMEWCKKQLYSDGDFAILSVIGWASWALVALRFTGRGRGR